MTTDIGEWVAEIRRLQNELEVRWDALRQQLQYRFGGHKVRFSEQVRRLPQLREDLRREPMA